MVPGAVGDRNIQSLDVGLNVAAEKPNSIVAQAINTIAATLGRRIEFHDNYTQFNTSPSGELKFLCRNSKRIQRKEQMDMLADWIRRQMVRPHGMEIKGDLALSGHFIVGR